MTIPGLENVIVTYNDFSMIFMSVFYVYTIHMVFVANSPW